MAYDRASQPSNIKPCSQAQSQACNLFHWQLSASFSYWQPQDTIAAQQNYYRIITGGLHGSGGICPDGCRREQHVVVPRLASASAVSLAARAGAGPGRGL